MFHSIRKTFEGLQYAYMFFNKILRLLSDQLHYTGYEVYHALLQFQITRCKCFTNKERKLKQISHNSNTTSPDAFHVLSEPAQRLIPATILPAASHCTGNIVSDRYRTLKIHVTTGSKPLKVTAKLTDTICNASCKSKNPIT